LSPRLRAQRAAQRAEDVAAELLEARHGEAHAATRSALLASLQAFRVAELALLANLGAAEAALHKGVSSTPLDTISCVCSGANDSGAPAAR
jgi:hypothetical protein